MSDSILKRSWSAKTAIRPQMAGNYMARLTLRLFASQFPGRMLVLSDAARIRGVAKNGLFSPGTRIAQRVSVRLRASPIWAAILTWPKTTPPQPFGGQHHLAKEAYDMARKSRRTEGVGSEAPLANESPMTETRGETVPAVEKTVLPSEDAVRAATENSVTPPFEDIQAEPGILSIASAGEEGGDGSKIDPVTGIVEAALTDDFEVLEELGDESLRAAQSLARPYAENFRMLAVEAANYSKNCAETRAAFAGALLTAKSLEKAVQFQNSYAKSVYARFMAHLLKMNGLYWSLLGEASKPVTQVLTKAPRAQA
jgi:hypothetical protein